MTHYFKVFVLMSTLFLAPHVHAWDATYYLVRHAEKQSDGTHDPALTAAGEIRANSIANLIKDVDFDAVYSTNYKRTLATAAPAAAQAGLKAIIYDPRAEKFDAFISDMKHKTGYFLIVGHSNTTPVVAGALAGQNLPELQDHQYDHIYVVTRPTEGKPTLKIIYSEPRTP